MLRGCAVRCGRALVGACSALLGMGRGEITCARKLSPNVIAYVCTHVDRSGRRNSGRYMAPAQPGLRFAASYRGRECVVRAPGPRGTAPAGPPRAEREDDEDRDPRSDDEIFVVPRKIRYALRARRRNVARRAFRSLLYLIIPVRRAVHCVHALLIDIVRREIRSVHVHGRAVDSNDDVTTARENETRSTRAGESREASLRADPGRSL